MPEDNPALVSTSWLAARLGRADLRVVDASWYLPTSGRDAVAEFAAGHVPGAVFYDLDATSDDTTSLPHMLPPAQRFAERMSELGLSDGDSIVVYDGSGVNLSAPRAWWTLRVFGHERVALLDGGLVKWKAEGRPLERDTPAPRRGRFTARLDPQRVRRLPDLVANLAARGEQVVDTRSASRFDGSEPEFRPGVRSGHMPDSRNLPFTELVAPDGTYLPSEALRRRLAAAGVDLDRPVVATCGSGTSACSLVFALHLLGHDQVAVYDGAWAEWGGRSDTPVELGPPG
ncbi:MAG TPA: 3-mercaptopyruvate sulfurtransferase [Gemmatimonadales bacterium]|jgi:thiosulfate/3-mercaptopyruvate sulfurtransferase|nr:3-mercaptopyruvate sulfurtransferase [Gemmatimonadales bacterium]